MQDSSRHRISPFRFQSFLGEPDPEEEMIRAREEARRKAEAAKTTPPAPPTFSENELKTASEKAHAAGREEGYQHARQEIEAVQKEERDALKNVISSIDRFVLNMVEQQNVFLDQLQAIIPNLAIHIAKKVAGAALQDNPLIEIEAMVSQCFADFVAEKHLVIFVNPAIVPYLEGILAEKYLSEHSTSPLNYDIKEDANLAVEDCRVEWPSGAMERSTEKLWAQMAQMIDGFQVLFGAPVNIADAQAAIEQVEEQAATDTATPPTQEAPITPTEES